VQVIAILPVAFGQHRSLKLSPILAAFSAVVLFVTTLTNPANASNQPQSVSASMPTLMPAAMPAAMPALSSPIQNVTPPTQRLLMAFHGCAEGATDCNNPVNHRVYLAQSENGAQWSLVPGWTPLRGSVPDVFRRGDTVYVISTGGVARVNMTTGSVTVKEVSVRGGDLYVDPSLAQLPDGRLVMFYLPGIIGQDPARCAPGESSCVKSIKSAVEVPGSEGTEFIPDPGVRVQEAITQGSFSDPDVFFNGSTWVLYVSKGPSIDAYTSSELLGSYAPSGPVSAGDGGVGSGIEASPGQVQTFVHSSRIASSFIKRGVSATGITLIGDFATVLSGGDVGLSDYVASPGVAVNTAGLACPTCEAAAASTKEVKEITQIRCVKKKGKKGKRVKIVRGEDPTCPRGYREKARKSR
jgi:hypothetical protein